jgi:hypothetical protein
LKSLFQICWHMVAHYLNWQMQLLLGYVAWGFNWLVSVGWGERYTLQVLCASWHGVWGWRDWECDGLSPWPKRRRIAGNTVWMESISIALTKLNLMFMYVWNEDMLWFFRILNIYRKIPRRVVDLPFHHAVHHVHVKFLWYLL